MGTVGAQRWGDRSAFRFLSRVEDLTAPETEPVTLAQVWSQLRMTGEGSPPETEDDELLTLYIQAARERAERMTNRTIAQRRRLAVYSAFPTGMWRVDAWWLAYWGAGVPEPLMLPAGPAANAVVTYYDAANTLQILAASAYTLNNNPVPCLALPSGAIWPQTAERPDAVQVEYDAGWQSGGSPLPTPAELRAVIPSGIRTAILFAVQALYDNPADSERTAIDRIIERYAGNHRVHTF